MKISSKNNNSVHSNRQNLPPLLLLVQIPGRPGPTVSLCRLALQKAEARRHEDSPARTSPAQLRLACQWSAGWARRHSQSPPSLVLSLVDRPESSAVQFHYGGSTAVSVLQLCDGHTNPSFLTRTRTMSSHG